MNSVTKQVAADLRDVGDYLNARFFEREDVVECLLLSALTKLHLLMYGIPGTAKSAVTSEFVHCLGGSHFWQQMDEFLGKEDFLGQVDPKAFADTGEWVRKTQGMMPEADIVTLEEVGKVGPATLTMLLTLLNERSYRNGDKVLQAKLLFCVGTTNELLNDPSGAMTDRFTIRTIVDDFKNVESFKKMLRGEGTNLPRPTVDIDTLRKVADVEVPAVILPDTVLDAMVNLRSILRHEHEITPSPRRWNQSKQLLKASAVLNDRDTVDADDLAVLRHVLWESPEQIAAVTNVVLSHSSPAIKVLLSQSGVLDDVELGFAERLHEPTAVKSQYAGEAQIKMKSVQKALGEVSSTSPRVLARIDEVKDRWRGLKAQVYAQGMGMESERARVLAEGEI